MPKLKQPQCYRSHGFTMVELMVSMSVFAILAALAIPSFQVFMAENRAKGKAIELAAAIKSAQAEASRRNRQVVFTLTSSPNAVASIAGSVNGNSWASVVLPLSGSSDVTTPTVVNVGGFTENTSDVVMTGSSAGICFLPDGSIKANTSTGITTGNCTVSASGASVLVTPSKGQKIWQVLVSPFGKVSSCMGTKDSANLFTCAAS